MIFGCEEDKNGSFVSAINASSVNGVGAAALGHPPTVVVAPAKAKARTPERTTRSKDLILPRVKVSGKL